MARGHSARGHVAAPAPAPCSRACSARRGWCASGRRDGPARDSRCSTACSARRRCWRWPDRGRARRTDDLGAAAAVVGELAQRPDVDALVGCRPAAAASPRPPVPGIVGPCGHGLPRPRPPPAGTERASAAAAASTGGVERGRPKRRLGTDRRCPRRRRALRCRGSSASARRTEVRLLVSLPSDTMRMAFLRCAPPCDIGTASATASYIAVPPAGLMRASRRLTSCFSVVQSCTSCGAGAEADQEHVVVGRQQLEQEAVERLPRRLHLLAGHAAAGVERDAQADRHALGAEVRDLLRACCRRRRRSPPG